MSGCDGNCSVCPALRERAPGHLAEHALPETAPGPYRGGSLVMRAVLTFILPLVVALAGALSAGDLGGLLGFVAGVGLAILLRPRAEVSS